MTNKEKVDLAIQLLQEVVKDMETAEFKNKSEKNKKISEAIDTFGDGFLIRLQPLATWVHDSD